MNDNLLFIYGTLMSGQHLNKMMAEAQHIGRARTTSRPPLLMYAGTIPYAVEVPTLDDCYAVGSQGVIHGELWRVSDRTLAMLDILEGHPTAYKRTLQEFTGNVAGCVIGEHEPGDAYLAAYAYIYQGDPAGFGASLIPSGDFRNATAQ